MFFQNLLHDLHYATRQLRRAPGVALTVVLTLIARKLIGVVIYIDAKHDAGGFLLAALLLVIAGLIAALIPAARAASIEPMQALRAK